MIRLSQALLVLALAGTVAAQEDTLTLTQRSRIETWRLQSIINRGRAL